MYNERIRILENQIRTNDNTLFAWERAGKSKDDKEFVELRDKQYQLKEELRKLNRLQWDYDHERVSFDDDR